MYYILYKTTNILTGEFYIGVHRTSNLDDKYLGSGIRLQRAISKYGQENFQRIILEQFITEDEMYIRERQIVTREFIDREETYNLVSGGRGVREHQSWIHTNPEAQRQHARKAALIGVQKRKQYEYVSEEIKRKISQTLLCKNRQLREQGQEHPVTGIVREKIKCPHCNKSGAMNVMVRWHFDKCKQFQK